MKDLAWEGAFILHLLKVPRIIVEKELLEANVTSRDTLPRGMGLKNRGRGTFREIHPNLALRLWNVLTFCQGRLIEKEGHRKFLWSFQNPGWASLLLHLFQVVLVSLIKVMNKDELRVIL